MKLCECPNQTGHEIMQHIGIPVERWCCLILQQNQGFKAFWQRFYTIFAFLPNSLAWNALHYWMKIGFEGIKIIAALKCFSLCALSVGFNSILTCLLPLNPVTSPKSLKKARTL